MSTSDRLTGEWGDGPPLVSIVVPCYQQGRFLAGCLRSLTTQTYPHVEVLVYDNLSTDETASVLQSFRPKLSVISERDLGQTDALIRGFRSSRGQVLGWLNADDMLMPDALERAVAALTDTAGVEVVYGHCAFLNESGQFLGYFVDVRPFERSELLAFSNFVPQPGTLFTRSAYQRVGGLDPRLAYTMDWDLWCRMARSGVPFRFLPEVLAACRVHRGSKTSLGGWRRSRELLDVNLRHSSSGFPWLAAEHLYARLPKRLRLGRRVLRWMYQHLPGRAEPGPGTVHGLDGFNRIAKTGFRLRFPVEAPLAGATLRIHGARGLDASLGGREASLVSRERGMVTARWDSLAGVGPLVDLEGEAERDVAEARLFFEWRRGPLAVAAL